MRRTLAGIVAMASGVVLVAALVALVAGGDTGVAERTVTAFGQAPPPVAPAERPALTPSLAGGELAPLPNLPAASSSAVPVRSGLIGELPGAEAPAPVRLIIAGIDVTAPVTDVGYDASAEEMEVPRSPGEVGWYRFGASPGQEGSAVLAAHVDFNGVAGAFYDLHLLEAGASVVVVMDDGSRQRWEVVARRQYGKELLPTDAIFARHGEPTLAHITCGGPFDGRRYEDNVVVFARPAGAAQPEPGPA